METKQLLKILGWKIPKRLKDIDLCGYETNESSDEIDCAFTLKDIGTYQDISVNVLGMELRRKEAQKIVDHLSMFINLAKLNEVLYINNNNKSSAINIDEGSK